MPEGKSNIVTGFRASLVRICTVANILFLTLFSGKNPVRSLRILKRIRDKRSGVQGLKSVRKYVKAGHRYFFSENIPGWPSHAFNRFFKTEIARESGSQGRLLLSTVIFAITSRCRLGCSHCYEWSRISASEKLSSDNLLRIVSMVKSYGVSHIQLSGGEPLERFSDLIRLIRYARDKTDLWILTSGFGLTLEMAFSLKEAGLTGADISLDHWDENEHNRSRNNPLSFFWAKEAAINCGKAGLATTLSLCAFRTFVTTGNIQRYAELAREWGIGFIRILEPRRVGRYNGKNIFLDDQQIGLLEEFFQTGNLSDKYLRYPIVTYPGYHQRRTGCMGAGNRYFYIDSAGEIHACPFCQHSAGNALSVRLEDAIHVLRSYSCQEFKMSTAD